MFVPKIAKTLHPAEKVEKITKIDYCSSQPEKPGNKGFFLSDKYQGREMGAIVRPECKQKIRSKIKSL